MRYLLGIEVARSTTRIVINQHKYALDLIADAGLTASKPSATPIEKTLHLTTHNYDVSLKLNNAADPVLSDGDLYRRLVGMLLYLTMTHPDIAYVVQRLSQFMHNPKKSHLTVALPVIRYVKLHPGQGIFFPDDNSVDLTTFCDSDWAACPFTRLSLNNYYVKLGSTNISWKVKKQHTVSKLSVEAEYRSLEFVVSKLI